MSRTVAATGSLFADAGSTAAASATVPVDDCIMSIVSQDELDEVEVKGSDKYYVPRKKDLLKKERERQRKEEMDFSDDEDEGEEAKEEMDGLGGVQSRAKPKPHATLAQPPRRPHDDEEEHKEAAPGEDEPSPAPSIRVIPTSTDRAPVAVIEPQRQPPSIAEYKVTSKKAPSEKEEMSDEEDEEAPRPKQPPPRSSSSTSPRAPSTGVVAQVAPLINPVALTFFLHRFALTCLGGLQLRFVSPSPRLLVPLSCTSFLLPTAVVLAFSGVTLVGSLSTAAGAVVGGAVGGLLHAAVHLWSAFAARQSSERSEDGEVDRWSQPGAIRSFLFPIPLQPAFAPLIVRVLTASTCYGVLIGLATAALPLSHPLIAASGGGYGVLVAACLLSVSTSLYPLQHRPLVDPNVWDANTDSPSTYTRPLHLLILLVPLLIVTYLPAIGTPAPALVLLILLALMPVLHAVGVLPQLSPLAEYVVEQAGLLLFASSPSISLRQTALSVASLLVASTVVFLLAVYRTSSATVLVAIALAVPVTCSWSTPGQRRGKVACLLLSADLIIAGIALETADVDLLASIASIAPTAGQWWWDAPLFACLGIAAAISGLRRPFLCRLIRNPLYSAQPLPTRLLTALLLPTFLTLYLTVNLSLTDVQLTASFPSFLLSALLLRQYLNAWTSPSLTTVALTGLLIVDRAAPSSSFTALPFQLRVWLACVAVTRLSALWSKLLFFVALTWTSHTQPKLKTRNPRLLLALSILLLPYHALLLVVTALLAIPVYPLLGASILLPSFPRRTRVWPAVVPTPPGSLTTFYYQHLVDAARARLPHILALAGPSAPGTPDVLLLRAEPYTLILVVTVNGPAVSRVWFKGLELQRTSCHTMESLHLDECIDRWKARPLVNPHPLHLYQPCGAISLDAYLPSTVSLVGVFDSREHLQLVRSAFYRQLLLALKRRVGEGEPESVEQWPVTVPERELEEAKVALPLGLLALLFPAVAPPEKGGAGMQGIGRLLLTLYSLVYVLPAPSARPMSPAALYSLYSGKMPLTLYGSKGIGPPSPWVELVVGAFRQAVALVFYAYCDGDLEKVEGEAGAYREWVEEVEGRVGVGGAGDDVGRVMAETGKTEWFALEAKDDGSLTAVRVQRQAVEFALVRGEWAAWEGVWVGSGVELMYFGNDDDERYSIQAHEGIMRNTIVQAGEAPVGYAAYTGEEVSIAKPGWAMLGRPRKLSPS